MNSIKPLETVVPGVLYAGDVQYVLNDKEPTWLEQFDELTDRHSITGNFDLTHPTSRESAEDIERFGGYMPNRTVPMAVLHDRASWLYRLHAGAFLEIAKATLKTDDLFAPLQIENGPVINIQSRLEASEHPAEGRPDAHEDTNPAALLLGLDDMDETTGGGLAVSKAGSVRGYDQLISNAYIDYPRLGRLVLLRGGNTRTHCAMTLHKAGILRKVAVMDLFTTAAPESSRSSSTSANHIGQLWRSPNMPPSGS